MKLHVTFSILSVTVFLLGSGCASLSKRSQVLTGQHPQSFAKEIRKTVNANYLLYLPNEYPESKREWPLILFLHGAGERGNDLEKVKIHGPPKLIENEGKKFPFVIVSPQCPDDDYWNSKHQIDTMNSLLDEIVSRYRIDKNRIYVTGLSMGGHGTWSLAIEYPDRFAAIAPICGRGDFEKIARINHLPIWVFHGAKDKVVSLKSSEDMVDALKKAGGNVKFTVYPDAHHDSWTETYSNPELYEWFLRHRLTVKK